jgi:DNA-binding CsgD family transcriptional regulator/PAS domain-containing protein
MKARAGAANELFVAAVEAIYESAAQPSNWAGALEKIAEAFGDVGANLIWQRDDGSFGAFVSPSLLPVVEEWSRWQHADIRALRAVEQSLFTRRDVLTDRHLVTAEEIEEHPFYTQFLVPSGLGWLASASVSPDPAVVVWISVQRAKAKAPFSDEELETLARLARHAEHSLRLSVQLFDAKVSKLGLGEALARVGVGVFLLDARKRVIFANRAAEDLAAEGVKVVDGFLSAPQDLRALKSEIERVIRAAPEEADAAPKPVLFHRASCERPLTFYVLPITARGLHDAAAQFLSHARAVVLAIDPQAGAPADPAVVRDLLGLTLGEARVAALVGSGVTPRGAAEKLGIAEDTARVVLKRVFAKAGVSRQSELSVLLTKLVLR